jgi:hypothetical protein
MSQRNILSINLGIGDRQNVQHKSRLNVQGSHCHRDKMLQWMFWLGQNVTVDVVNLDVLSRHRGLIWLPGIQKECARVWGALFQSPPCLPLVSWESYMTPCRTVKPVHIAARIRDNGICIWIMNWANISKYNECSEATYLGCMFRTGVNTISRHVILANWAMSGYAPTRFFLGRIDLTPKGLAKPPNIAQKQPNYRHSAALCCRWSHIPAVFLFPPARTSLLLSQFFVD